MQQPFLPNTLTIHSHLGLDNGVSVTVKVFESRAVSFDKQIEDYKVDPQVVVAICINLKLIGGLLFMNVTSELSYITDAGECYIYKQVIIVRWSQMALGIHQRLHC
ncbi:hypothetical protein Bca4012_026710 [Brassica carinata]